LASAAGRQNPADSAPGSGLALRESTQPTGRTVVDGPDINHRKTTLPTTAAGYNQSIQPNWLHYLDDAQTIRDELLQLTALGEAMPLLLSKVPASIRGPLLNHFPTLRRRLDVPDILGSDSQAAAQFAAVCHNTASPGDSQSFLRTLEREFTWSQSLKPMSRAELANTLCKHADKLLKRLFSDSGLFPSSMETTASVCQFLVSHGIYPAIIHRLSSPSDQRRNFMMIPARDDFLLITRHCPSPRHYVSNHDLMVLGHSGMTCADFITRHVRAFRDSLMGMLQFTSHPGLTQTYRSETLAARLQCYDAEPADKVLSQVSFLASEKVQQTVAHFDIHELELVKLMLSSPENSEGSDDEQTD